jgi:multicomponent Na+:H+ antiporter subunit D
MTFEWIVFPIFVHLFGAVILLVFWKTSELQRKLSVGLNLIYLGFASFLFILNSNSPQLSFTQAGSWAPPFGIILVLDNFSSILILLTGILGLCISLFASVGISDAKAQFGFYPVFHFLLMGLSGAFLTGDLFNLYVWFEIVIISSFVLMTLGDSKASLRGALPYVAMNLLASIIFLTGIALVYGITGSLNFADLSLKISELKDRDLIQLAAILFLIGFGMKSAIFPLYFWLPLSYHTTPSAVAGLFAGLLTKLGIYALFRVFSLVIGMDSVISMGLEYLAILTIFAGGFGAITQRNIRKMLSYIIICHIGYLVGGFSLHSQLSVTGAIYYLIHDIPAKANLFLATGILFRVFQSHEFKNMGGMQSSFPKISFLLGLVFFTVVGIPPLSGFFPKIPLFQSAFFLSLPLSLAYLFGSAVTLFCIGKIWVEVFWGEEKAEGTRWNLSQKQKILSLSPIVLLFLVSISLSIWSEEVFVFSGNIAKDILHPEIYVNSIFSKGEVP